MGPLVGLVPAPRPAQADARVGSVATGSRAVLRSWRRVETWKLGERMTDEVKRFKMTAWRDGDSHFCACTPPEVVMVREDDYLMLLARVEILERALVEAAKQQAAADFDHVWDQANQADDRAPLLSPPQIRRLWLAAFGRQRKPQSGADLDGNENLRLIADLRTRIARLEKGPPPAPPQNVRIKKGVG